MLAGNFDAARVADHIVLVGASAAGLNDLKATPIAPDMPGVEIHAQLIEQVLGQDFLFRPDWAPGAEILFAVFVGLVVIVSIPMFGMIESLNLGTSSGIVLYEVARQRREYQSRYRLRDRRGERATPLPTVIASRE